jgi:uncharacterized damage-inducible protein DinB
MIVERLRGTPVRIEEKLQGMSPALLTKRVGDTWSIQENIGHLLDLEDLWMGRLEDFLAGAKELRPADLSNRATHEGNHNAKAVRELAEAFRTRRLEFVDRLDSLDEAQVSAEALHPRLKQPMRVIDLCLFTAEHDDQHLARITELIKQLE